MASQVHISIDGAEVMIGERFFPRPVDRVLDIETPTANAAVLSSSTGRLERSFAFSRSPANSFHRSAFVLRPFRHHRAMDSSVLKSVAFEHIRVHHTLFPGDSFKVTIAYLHWHGETPIYVGVGNHRRAYEFHIRNKLWHEYVAQHGKPQVEIPYEDMTKEAAWAIEEILIARYGRAGIDPGGTLLNRSTGGPRSGAGVVRPDNAARLVSEETRAKISAAHRGKIVSEETRAKMSQAARGRDMTHAINASRLARLRAHSPS
jgi:NUMOD3 motif